LIIDFSDITMNTLLTFSLLNSAFADDALQRLIPGPDASLPAPTRRLTIRHEPHFDDFGLTHGSYRDTDDHAAACQREFGDNAFVADWTEDGLDHLHGIQNLMSHLGIPVHGARRHPDAPAYWVTRNFQKHDRNTNRVYFLANHGTRPPIGWLAHDSNDGVNLGSWFGLSGKVLCHWDPLPEPEPQRVNLEWSHNGFPLFELDDLVQFQTDIKDYKHDLQDIVEKLTRFEEPPACPPGVFCEFRTTVAQEPPRHRFDYDQFELREIARRLTKLELILIRKPFIFGGTLNRPFNGRVNLDHLLDNIHDVIQLLDKIDEFVL